MIPSRSWRGVRENPWGLLFATRRGCSNRERSPSLLAGRPWSFVGSAGTSGRASLAGTCPATALAFFRIAPPMAPAVPASRERRVMNIFGALPGFWS